MHRTLYLVACVACLAACGRLGFDPRGAADGGGSGGDGTPGDGGATCAAVEQCNGIDDTCDGAIDEGCPCHPFDITFQVPTPRAGPGFAWTGTGYALLSDDGAQPGILPIAEDGTLGPLQTFDAPLTMYSVRETVAWDGAHVVVAANGVPGDVALFRSGTAERLVIAPSGDNARVVRRGDRLGVAWHQGTGLWLREVLPDDTMTEPVLLLTASSLEAFTATPRGYAVTSVGGMPRLVEYDVTTQGITGHPFTAGGGQIMSLAAGPSGFFAAFRIDGTIGELFDAAGAPLASVPVPAPPGLAWGDHDLVATTTGYRVAGHSTRSPADFMTLDLAPDATPVGGGTVFGSLAVAAGRTALAQPFVASGIINVRVMQSCF